MKRLLTLLALLGGTGPVVARAAGPATVPSRLSVAPRPASALLRVQLAGPDQEITLQLLDVLGRIVHQQVLYHGADLDVRALPPGYYFLRARTATGQLLAGGQQIIVAP